MDSKDVDFHRCSGVRERWYSGRRDRGATKRAGRLALEPSRNALFTIDMPAIKQNWSIEGILTDGARIGMRITNHLGRGVAAKGALAEASTAQRGGQNGQKVSHSLPGAERF